VADQVRAVLELRKEHGPDRARELSVEAMVGKQRDRMAPLIDGRTLAAGLGQAKPALASIGIVTEFLDASTPDQDVAVEVMLTCSCRLAADALGLDPPEPIVCDLDLAATAEALPELEVTVLGRQTAGAAVCAFRFARPRTEESS
jgi:hypothetical protein